MRPLLLGLGLLLLAACGPRGRSPDPGWWRYSLGGSSPFWQELHRFDEDPTVDQRLIVALTIFADERHAVHHVLVSCPGNLLHLTWPRRSSAALHVPCASAASAASMRLAADRRGLRHMQRISRTGH